MVVELERWIKILFVLVVLLGCMYLPWTTSTQNISATLGTLFVVNIVGHAVNEDTTLTHRYIIVDAHYSPMYYKCILHRN